MYIVIANGEIWIKKNTPPSDRLRHRWHGANLCKLVGFLKILPRQDSNLRQIG